MDSSVKRILYMFIGSIAAGLLLAACSTPAAPTTTQTAAPTLEPNTAPTSLPEITETAEPTAEPTVFVHPSTLSINVIYQTADNQLMGYITGTGETWPFAGSNFQLQIGPHATIASHDTNIYGMGSDSGEPSKVYAVTPVGVMPVYSNPPYVPAGVAVTIDPADPVHPLLAVGEYDPAAQPLAARLVLTWLDSDQTQVAAEQESEESVYFAPWRWSGDASRLYYSQESLGLGGYILFDGYSSLYVFDRASGETTALIGRESANRSICLDDISPDETLVAHHCSTEMQIGLMDLQTGEDVGAISAPTEIADQVKTIGSALFSPNGARIAFGLALNNVGAEQGWIAVSDALNGSSHIVMTSEVGSYLRVVRWIDDSTLVVQSTSMEGAPTVWLVPLDGSAPQQLGEGNFITLIPPLN